MKKRTLLTLLISTLLIVLSQSATAQPKTGTVYKDWVAVCQTIPNTKKQHCHIQQTSTNTKTNKPVLHTLIGKLAVGKKQLVAIFVVPKLLGSKTKLRLAFSPKAYIDFPIESCDKKRKECYGGLPLEKNILKAFKKAKVAIFSYKQGKKEIKIPVSMMGISAGLNAIKK